ncbi:TIM-barrel domain-containing protein [Streptomyces sp. R-07]|uniref:TIM-barrel domain-containing protein n=1 Tax=Streptomyces sp. R-07 TaxID=3404052 RepID=UPI003CE79C08
MVGYATDARAADMPSGWFLPNDGYGCGYTTPLKSTVDALKSKGFQTGPWTSTGLSNIGTEVGTAGSRGVKTDAAWIGGGYKYAFDGVRQAVDGIEKNSDARRYVWTVDGWAGTQRNAVVWTGDTSGTWDAMRWHVPAITGAGLSALNYASGDVDGIFQGSPKTYVRDLQWKALTPAFMTMSGWGATGPEAGYQDKQPWRFSDPYLSINRKYLKLKMRMMPYLYSASRVATETGTPTVRAMVLEYPDDPVARGNQTSGQFMSGDSLAAEISATGRATPLPANVTLVNGASASCVDLPYSSTTAGTEPALYTCHGGTNQRWTFTAAGTLTGKDGVCLDGSGTTVTVQPCNGSASQEWQLGAQSSVTSGGRCLAPVGSGTANGTKLELATCSGSASQRWTPTG